MVQTAEPEPDTLAFSPDLLIIKGSFTPMPTAMRPMFKDSSSDKPELFEAMFSSFSFANTLPENAKAIANNAIEVFFMMCSLSYIQMRLLSVNFTAVSLPCVNLYINLTRF